MITTAIIEWAEAQKRQKFTWLEDHGSRSKRPRPETETENKLATSPCSIPSLLFARGGYPRDVNAGF
ncbi:hypothetical protein J4T90_19250 [Sinorhizobium medicae]|uniref:hypothetical protein n=1 Tax=Sinorhizobium medicae TaxID=110321 RepID=UPI001F23927B|nr:hypothetical protein [Sinorhizobium medicae]